MDPSQTYNGPNLDGFGKLRTSTPLAQFQYQNQYNKGPLIWNESITGVGSVTHLPNASSVALTTGSTASGNKIIRQSKGYFRYTPGKSLAVICTATVGAAVNNVRRRVGYFDADNGVFFEQANGASWLVLRSKVSGAVVDERVSQTSWNLDRMDGTGPSRQTLDITKSQIFEFDVQWLGVGSVRCAIEVGGVTYYVHEFEHANMTVSTYMTTANLPIRYEIENIGVAASVATLEQICSTVVTEQGAIDDEGYYTHGAANGITAVSVTTRRSVLAIRPKATFNGIVNRGKIEIDNFEVLAGGNNVYWELVYGGTLGGSPSWASAGDNALIEFDVAGTTVTGGEVIAHGYAPTGVGIGRILSGKDISALYPLALDIAGANPPVLALVCTSFTGTATVTGAINVKEFY